ncbi:MAG TPA: YccF domain-containing protein [Corynebacterium variabile]|uniref:YccF domain-containing protein n=1 Tax=Corynebacterium variabile TaxID=1727 RepID=A0A3B9QTD9_9CORY|nr:YccF domain-containing protein [Corynebacterium variabile]
MRLLLNIIWLVLSGFWLFCGYVLAGIIACIFIVTIPFGVASFRVAGYVLWPFGREVVAAPGAGVGSGIGNVIWFLVAGLWLALGHIATAFLLAITVIGLPLAWANLKLIPVTCFPFGKRVVPSSGARPA